MKRLPVVGPRVLKYIWMIMKIDTRNPEITWIKSDTTNPLVPINRMDKVPGNIISHPVIIIRGIQKYIMNRYDTF